MFEVTTSNCNKDLKGFKRASARDYYLRLWGNFDTKFGSPVVEQYKDKYILRADLAPGGLKSFGAERIIAESDYDTMVYVAPRQGHAPDAIAMIAKKYNKKCVFFMPASKQVSDHQGSLFAYDHCEMKFVKIAAMPVLNKYAKDWAEQNNAHFIPFGLTGEPTVTAGLVNMCKNISKQIKDPSEIYCAVSTGTMVRALQIGWPNAKAYGIAVARNIKDGEKGEAIVTSATMPFLKKINTDHIPFPTTAAYDAKAFDLFEKQGAKNSIFINVGSDDHINRNLSCVDTTKINSQRKWGDHSDFK